ncbi:hypothetical protein GW933_04060 [Candidatus Falkowbacteria bacterium]|nr:hypothetical protein [Candidatus Falkowbacteria bacterium]
MAVNRLHFIEQKMVIYVFFLMRIENSLIFVKNVNLLVALPLLVAVIAQLVETGLVIAYFASVIA